jgi:hypothetical protein
MFPEQRHVRPGFQSRCQQHVASDMERVELDFFVHPQGAHSNVGGTYRAHCERK